MTRKLILTAKAVMSALVMLGCTTTLSPAQETLALKYKGEPTPYAADAEARTEVEEILNESAAEDKMTIIAMGANWCHDSRSLAARFEQERFQTLLEAHYNLLYVDVGQKDRNVDIANRFGVDRIEGTPTVFVLSPEGDVLNLDTAPTWRNAHSRSDDEIFDYFRQFAHPRYGD